MKVLEMSLVLESPGIYLWFSLTSMYRTPCVNQCTKYSCYVLTEQFLQLVMNVLRWIVLSHCIYRVKLLFVCNLTLLGYDRVLEKCFRAPGKFWKCPGIFCKQEREP